MRRRALPAVVATVAAALVLAGCTPPAATPTAWQQSVQTVAEQASTGDYATALTSLDALEAEVTARRDAGEITADEADAILTRIVTVRADLTSLVPAPSSTPTATPEPSQTTGPSQSPEPSQTTESGTDDQQDTVTDDGGDDSSNDGPADKAPDPGNNGNGKGPGKDGGGPGGGPGKKG
ncbi:hypothetical protein M3667_01790 [Microbacterium sp. P26]|uniref:hypothetical protein n=1 Tax=Microbacterium TaxID=33882 RepID=UPI00204180B7|nr:hypothetical protein [Microbacterium sp. P26]MCM3500609.1 hypothetical protein [Microbacterium sp. P26]